MWRVHSYIYIPGRNIRGGNGQGIDMKRTPSELLAVAEINLKATLDQIIWSDWKLNMVHTVRWAKSLIPHIDTDK